MSNKDFRELQLSSSQLVLIFLAILVLGIVIFLLGVSVGKKQAQIIGETQTAGLPTEQIKQDKPALLKETPEKTVDQEGEKIEQELASHKKAKEDVTEKAPPVTSPPQAQNLYFIQVGAYSNKQAALTLADNYRANGYNSVVLEPFSTDRREIYRVRLGGYATRELAQKAKQELMRIENKKASDYFIIRQ
jgi:cell division septation protein DedD